VLLKNIEVLNFNILSNYHCEEHEPFSCIEIQPFYKKKKIQNNKFTSLLNFIKHTQDIMLQSLIKVTNQSDPSKVKTLDEPHSW